MYQFSQEQIFIFFFIIGIIIGFIFDIFRVIRKSFKTTDFITLIEDIIFLLISSILIIGGIIKINGGEVRFYLFLGIFLGGLIYSLTISNLYVIIFYEFVKICKKIFKIPFLCIIKFLQITKSIIKKDF
ncbi:MAG TPA: hypothetical protein IAD08_05135 [Candidatus Scatovivens faecipullorum]|nr:hypothetical protein [Candidatus Scatovivens faecipullorum]